MLYTLTLTCFSVLSQIKAKKYTHTQFRQQPKISYVLKRSAVFNLLIEIFLSGGVCICFWAVYITQMKTIKTDGN